MNQTAMEMCRILLAGRRVAPETLHDTLGQIDLVHPRARRGFDIRSHARGHDMCWNGRALLRISNDGRTLAALDEIPRRFSPDRWLLMAARYACWLQGQVILHAAAVARRGSAMAIIGRSGAGKTTLARALEKAGWSKLADDMLLLAPDARVPRVVLRGEERILDWAWKSGLQVQSGVKRIDASPLSEIACGPAVRLGRLVYLHPERGGTRIRTTRISSIDAVAQLMASGFGALGYPQHRLELLKSAVRLTSELRTVAMKEPRGLKALSHAVRRVGWNLA